MPTVSWFYGIAIRMFFNDHAPPHFHAIYGRHEAQVSIDTGELINGSLPAASRRLVREWALRYHAELMENWTRIQPATRAPLQRIPGLDAGDE
jgi:hypothetical protein